jgi:hypothetical protein
MMAVSRRQPGFSTGVLSLQRLTAATLASAWISHGLSGVIGIELFLLG